MKTIAVLTDLSARSEHAARYAVNLAKAINANVLLFNAFLVPADMSMAAANVAWPLSDYDDIKADAETCLDKFCSDLTDELVRDHQFGQHLPAITGRCQEGPVVNTLATLQQDKNIILLVIATHGADDLSTFILGNNCHELIDQAKLPLLIVPQNATFKELKKMVFATDVRFSDTEYIKAIAELARHSSAEITVANVNADIPLDIKHEEAISLLMNKITENIKYKHIHYRSVLDDNPKRGLQWLINNLSFDMLVMVHRKTGFFDMLFGSSITKKLASNTAIPLLVYPYPMPVIPGF
ncbi:MAG: universal stress protein [Mucilaginibacter sp.]